jgi:peptidoglycan/xylan/chitin deacetylase (PgdA/CDA1 family)
VKAILTYHSIDDSASPVSVSPAVFALHARWLASRRVRVLALTDLLAHPDDAGDAVAVTFDDGFLNILTRLEALLSQGVPVTIFAVSGHAGGTNAWGGREQSGIPTLPLLNWDQLAHLAGKGASIEAHSRSHPFLTRIPGAQLDDELEGCREDLRTRLGSEAEHFAYPYGDVNEAVSGRAAQAYRFGHTTDFRGLGTGDAAMRLPRLDMYYFRAPGQLEAWGTPAFTRRMAIVRARRALRGFLGQ